MKFWEAIKALEEGKSIRNGSWNHSFVVKLKNGKITDSDGFVLNLNTIWGSIEVGNTWEVVNEGS